MQGSSELINPTLTTPVRKSLPLPARWLLLAVMLVVGTAVVAPFYFSRNLTDAQGHKSMLVPVTHDMAQHLAIMEQFETVLRAGTFYPRWLPDVNAGYGLAWTNFYSPAFYYPAALVNAVVKDRYHTLFVLCALSLFASGAAFYLLSRQFYGRVASAGAALFYMLLPYHTIDLYWRGAFPELQGFVFVPLIVYFAYRAASRGRLSDYAGLGLCQGIYYVTHFPVAYLTTYTVALYALVWAVSRRDWRILFRIGAGMTIALLVSAIYWLPAVLESKYAQEHFTTIFPYHNGYVTLLPAGDRFGELINQSFAIQGLALLVAIAVLRLTANFAGRSAAATSEGAGIAAGREVSREQTRLWVILGVTTTFMVTSLSIYISKLIPKIEAVSFPMRWMVITSFFTAIVVGAAMDRLGRPAGGWQSSLQPMLLWACRVAVGVVVAAAIWVSVGHILLESLENSPLSVNPVHYESAFIPNGGREPRNLPDTPKVVVEPAAGKGEVVSWEPARREIAVSVEEPSTVRLRSYNFPGWTARLDGQKIPIGSDLDGVQVIDVPAGRHGLVVTFEHTLPRTLGTVVTGLGFLLIIGLTVAAQRQEGEESIVGHGIAWWRSRERRSRRLLVVGTALLIGVLVLIAASRFFATREAGQATPRGGGITDGWEAKLQIPGIESIMVAVDDQALDDLTRALPAGDRGAVEKMLESGTVLRVASGTRVRVLESGRAKVKVRILEGDHILKEGWVSERWVQ